MFPPVYPCEQTSCIPGTLMMEESVPQPQVAQMKTVLAELDADTRGKLIRFYLNDHTIVDDDAFRALRASAKARFKSLSYS